MIGRVKELQSLKYVIISGKGSTHLTEAKVHDLAYGYWKRFWGEIYTQAGCPESFVLDDFLRQDFIPVLLQGEKTTKDHR